MRIRTETLAKFACAYSGIVWGLFWLPLRGLEQAGISGAWATFIFHLVPFVLAAPLLLWRWRQIIHGGWPLQFIGIAAAVSLVTYADAIVYTEVIRAMLLFYLTPLWSTLLARIVLNEPITAARTVAMAVALAGALVIFRFDTGLPLPRNVGDWMGLISGIAWAVAAVLMNRDERSASLDYTLVYFAWGAIVALLIALLPVAGASEMPAFGSYSGEFVWLVPVIVIVVMPGVFAALWGTPRLSPGIVGLLFMTEISVGTVTAALWAGEPFGAREIIGILLISGASVMETVFDWIKGRRARSTEF